MSWKQRTPLILIASLVLIASALAIWPRFTNNAQAVQTAQNQSSELIAQNNNATGEVANAATAQAAQTAAPAIAPNPVVVPEITAPVSPASPAEPQTKVKAQTPASAAKPAAEAKGAQEEATEEAEVPAGDTGLMPKVSEKALKAAHAKSAKAVKNAPARKLTPAEIASQRVGNRRNPVKPPIGPGERFDKPAEAMSYYLKKRLPEGETELPVERYFTALAQVKNMPQFSTALNKIVSTKGGKGGKAPQTQKAAGKRVGDVRPNLVGDLEAGVLGTWEDLGPGNVGGRTRSLIINPADPNIMYTAGVAGGIWKSVDAGESWSPLEDFMANLAVTCLAFDPINPDIIWAGTGEGFFNVDAVRGAGIFRSTNAGANWFRLPATVNANFHYVQDLVVSPANPNHIYAATRTGVHRSLDNGASWTNVLPSNAANGANGAMDLVIRTDATGQQTDYIYAAVGTFAQAHIWRNTDAGGAGVWTDVYTEAAMGRTSLSLAPSNQNVIYAMATCNNCPAGTNPNFPTANYTDGLLAVFRSNASGNAGSWTAQVRNNSPNIQDTLLLTNPINGVLTQCGFGTSQFLNQGWYDNQIAVDPTDPDKVWALGIDTFRSDNAGVNWGVASYWWFQGNGTPPANGDPQLVHADNHILVFHPQYNGTTNQMMYIGNDGGIYKTDNAKTGNVGYPTGITPSGGAVTPTSPICGNEYTPGGFYTVPDPVIWEPLNNGYQVTQFYHGLPYPGGATYFGGTQDNGTNRGTDASGSNAWQRILGGDGGYVAVNPTNTQILYAENFNLSFQRSDNGGANWTRKTTGISGDVFPFITVFRMDPNVPTRLWIGGRFMWRTDNQGDAWTRTSATQQTGGSITAMAIAPGNSNLVINGAASGQIRRTSTATTLDATSVLNTVWLQSFTPRGNGNGTISWLEYDPQNSLNVWATVSTFNGVANANGTSAGHVFKSVDGGATWTLADGTQTANNANAIPDIPAHVVVIDPTNSQRIYVGTDLGVFVSLDGGGNWYKEVTGFANVPVEALSIDTANGKARLFAFTHGRSAYRVDLSASCVTAVLPTNPPSYDKDGGTGSVAVTSLDTSCTWTAASQTGWIQINTGRTGAGTGAVTYTVLPNATSATRTGRINVAGTVVTITQDAQPATASITGQVVDGTHQPVAGANVTLTGTTAGDTVTNSAGGYSFNNLTPGGTYTVTVARPGLVFSTPSKTVDNLQGIAVENFAGYVTPPPVPAAQGRLIISEFRLRGATSADDEFIEFYNNSDSPLTITTTDGSEGWAVTGGDGNLRFIIPVNQTIPARGHYLATNSRGYSLTNHGGTNFAGGDASYSIGFPDDSGLTLFTTARPANYSEATRLDSVGFVTESNPLAREGVGLAALSTTPGEFSFVRRMTTGVPQDTDNNAADFVLVSTTGAVINGVQSVLGAPGPENVSSPLNRSNVIKASLVDPQCGGFGTPASACARVRTANGANPTNAAFGTLLIRRKFTNTSSEAVSRVRFRVVDITTLGNVTAGLADLRVLSSTTRDVTMTDGVTPVTLSAITLDGIPAQPNGGGLNSTLNFGSPLAAGASVNVEFTLGVMTSGNYRFFVNVEALP